MDFRNMRSHPMWDAVKTERVIKSCLTLGQINTAERMAENFCRLHGKLMWFDTDFRQMITEKRKEILEVKNEATED